MEKVKKKNTFLSLYLTRCHLYINKKSKKIDPSLKLLRAYWKDRQAAEVSWAVSSWKCLFCNLLWIIGLNSTQFPHYRPTSMFNPGDLALHFRQCLVGYNPPSSFMPAWTRKSFHSCLGEMGISFFIFFMQINEQRFQMPHMHFICAYIYVSELTINWYASCATKVVQDFVVVVVVVLLVLAELPAKMRKCHVWSIFVVMRSCLLPAVSLLF